jgi:hypothetical protein
MMGKYPKRGERELLMDGVWDEETDYGIMKAMEGNPPAMEEGITGFAGLLNDGASYRSSGRRP